MTRRPPDAPLPAPVEAVQDPPAATLVRRYVLHSLAAATLVAVVLCLALGAIAKEQEIAIATDLAARVSRHIAQELAARWLPERAADRLAPDDTASFDQLEQLFALHRKSLQVPRIVWFDAHGRVLHCDVRAAIGTQPDDDDLETALHGRISHEWRAATTPIHPDGACFEMPLLEVYVPITAADAPALAGHVIELYVDASGVEKRVAVTRLDTLLSCAAAAGALLLAVGGLVRGAQARLLAQNDQLRRSSVDLERQVEERTRALIRSRRLADVGTLAAGLAHEINNPLAIIGSCAQGLLDRLRRPKSTLEAERADFDEYLRSIESETFRCKRITESLLDFARSAPREPKVTSLRLLVEEVAGLMKPLAGRRRHVVRLRSGDDDLPVRIDANAIKQVVINLLGNAFDAVPEGGEIEITLARRGTVATVDVRDWGAGFGEAGPERIFEPFFTTKAPGEGAGMGLTVSRHLAELHGGRLVAEVPQDGPGARFRLELPLIEEGAPP